MTVVNIALPHIQANLHFSATSLSWVLNGYTLTSGGLLLGLGMGLVFVPLTTASLAGVPAADSGAASGLVTMLQLVGGALGLGVLVSVYGTAYRHAASHPLAGLSPLAQSQHMVTHGIATAFGFAAILNVCSLLVIIALIRAKRPAPARAPAPRPQEEAVAS